MSLDDFSKSLLKIADVNLPILWLVTKLAHGVRHGDFGELGATLE
jgi:hypothetical protein